MLIVNDMEFQVGIFLFLSFFQKKYVFFFFFTLFSEFTV